MSDPRRPSDPHDRPSDAELARLLRSDLHRHADDAPDPFALSDRVLARLAAGEQGSGRSHRRWTRAGAPLVAAASVAAVVAAAAIGVTLVHRHDTKSTQAADTTMHTMSQTLPPGPSVSHHVVPSTPTASATAAPAPDGFRVRDLSFLGDTTYALGQVCPNDACTGSALIRSTDGSSYTTVSRPSFPVGTGSDEVRSLRMNSASYGYAFGPNALYRTTDGGDSWTSMTGGAVALETYNGDAVRVTASGADCTSGCTYSVSTSNVRDSAWTAVTLPQTARGTKAFLVRTANDVYLATVDDTITTLYYSSDGGGHWQTQGKAICAGDFNGGSASLTSLASTLNGSVVAMCANSSSASVQVSANHGANFTMPAHSAPFSGPTPPTVAAFDAQTILVSADRLYRSTDGGEKFVPVRQDAGQANPNRVVFLGTESGSTARWVCGNGSTIWTSRDTGASWTDLSFS